MWPFKKKKKPTPKRMYAGAVIDRLTSDWIAQGTSQDAEVMASLPRLRNRSRQLGRDNDYVRNFFREVQNNVIGQGIKFQSQVRMQRGGKLDEKTNSAIEAAWAEWCRKENCHTAGKLCFRDIERLIIRSVFESGEVLVRFIYQPMGRLKTPFALEIIESDQLDDNYNGVSPQGNVIRMGVEHNSWGRPVAYHLIPHPGDIVGSTGINRKEERRIRVPAEEIIHLFPTERPGQTRGIPALASAITRLRHMQGYEEAEVIAARASAALMGFIESPEEEVSIKDDTQDGQSVTEFEPGVFKKLAPGEKINIPTLSRPGGQLDPFMRYNIRAFAAGVGMSYAGASKDSSQSNYSSSRLDLLSERDNWRAIQAWIIENFHQDVFERWLDMSVLSGTLALKGYELNPSVYRNVRWMPRGWSWVDPAKEVAAYKEAEKAGYKTKTEIIAESGGDVEETFEQRRRELELAEEKGLIFDTNQVQADSGSEPRPGDEDEADE